MLQTDKIILARVSFLAFVYKTPDMTLIFCHVHEIQSNEQSGSRYKLTYLRVFFEKNSTLEI